jgi:hypothetical protein
MTPEPSRNARARGLLALLPCLVTLAPLTGCGASDADVVLFAGQTGAWDIRPVPVIAGEVPLPAVSARRADGGAIADPRAEYLVCKGHFGQGGGGADIPAEWPFCSGDRVAASRVEGGVLRVSEEDREFTLFARVGAGTTSAEEAGRKRRVGVGLLQLSPFDPRAAVDLAPVNDVPAEGRWAFAGLPEPGKNIVEIGARQPVRVLVGKPGGGTEAVTTWESLATAMGALAPTTKTALGCTSSNSAVARVDDDCTVTGVAQGAARVAVMYEDDRIDSRSFEVAQRAEWETRRAATAAQRVVDDAAAAARAQACETCRAALEPCRTEAERAYQQYANGGPCQGPACGQEGATPAAVRDEALSACDQKCEAQCG